MTSVVVGFLIGQGLSAWVPADDRRLVLAGLIASLASLRGRSALLALGRVAGAMALGAALAAFAATPPSRDCFLPHEPTKSWIDVEVDDVSGDPGEGLRARGRVRRAYGDGVALCGSALLTLPAGATEPRVGERWRFHASLRPVRSFANPRGFDSAGSLARRGIWTSGHVGRSGAVRLAPAPPSWNAAIGEARRRIGQAIEESLPLDHAALLRSLVIGDQTRIRPELRRAVTDAGLAHLLSVSGLHVAIVWGLSFGAANWLLSRSEWLLLHASVRALAAAAGVPAALGYATLAGREVPALRSVTMTALLAFAWCAGRETDPLRLLVLAAGAVALARPGSPLDVSFQLSFVSVLALVLVGRWWNARRQARGADAVPRSRRERVGDHVVLGVVVSAAALAGTAPLVALHFERLGWIGVLTNPVLVPLAGTPATVLGLAGAVMMPAHEPIARTLFALAWWPLEALRIGSRVAAAMPWASASVPKPTILEVALAYAALALPWLPAGRRRLVASVVAALLALDGAAWTYERALRGDLRARILDVGQGDAAVLELPRGRVVVIDGGGFGRSRFDVGERVVLPYLRSRKIGRIDALVATHGDWDHQGGLHALARALPVRQLWVPDSAAERARLDGLERAVTAHGGIVRPVSAGDLLLEDGTLRIDCLHPSTRASGSSNDASLVLRVRFGSTAMLFTGDIEGAGESAITRRFAPQQIDVLKVPHHGSRTSSGASLLGWANPRIAIVSAGAGNAYGFPDAGVIARYAEHGTRALRTDVDGSVWVESDGRRVAVRTRAESSAAVCSLLGALC